MRQELQYREKMHFPFCSSQRFLGGNLQLDANIPLWRQSSSAQSEWFAENRDFFHLPTELASFAPFLSVVLFLSLSPALSSFLDL